VQAGHLILDRCWAPEAGPAWEHTYRINDPSVNQESLGGQEWVNERMRRNELVFEFSQLQSSDVYQGFLEVFRCCGLVRPFVVDAIHGDDDLLRRWYYRMYVKFSSQPEVSQGVRWLGSAPIKLIEAL
jgi:hypothetical protein